MVPAKWSPVNAVGVGRVRAIQIKSVRIGAMAGSVPPSSFVRRGAGSSSIRILVFVFSAEARSRRRHGRTYSSDKETI